MCAFSTECMHINNSQDTFLLRKQGCMLWALKRNQSIRWFIMYSPSVVHSLSSRGLGNHTSPLGYTWSIQTRAGCSWAVFLLSITSPFPSLASFWAQLFSAAASTLNSPTVHTLCTCSASRYLFPFRHHIYFLIHNNCQERGTMAECCSSKKQGGGHIWTFKKYYGARAKVTTPPWLSLSSCMLKASQGQSF